MLAQNIIDTRLRPLEAVKAARRLLSNPNATEEVFAILRAMRGRSGLRLFHRFRNHATGKRILAENRNLLETLTSSTALAAMPIGSLGHDYQSFMAEENLSTMGLVAPSRSRDEEPAAGDVKLFRERMRDMHDLTHTLTGYGRDPLGELCLLAFTYSHTRSPGMALIVLMGFLKIKSWPVRRAVIEAWRHGRRTNCWFPGMDWEALLPEQLAYLRRRFDIGEPVAYRAVMA